MWTCGVVVNVRRRKGGVVVNVRRKKGGCAVRWQRLRSLNGWIILGATRT